MSKIRLVDVAKAAGVSQTTVSRVMNNSGYVAENVKQAIEQAAEAIGYVHPERKRTIKHKNLIGIVSSRGKINSFFPNMSSILEQTAAEKNYYCINVTSDRLDNHALAYHASELAQIGVSALVVTSFLAPALNSDTRNLLLKLGLPVVFFERTEGCHGFNRILVDSTIGTYLATKHLINKGHRHLAYINFSRQAPVESMRLSGFNRAIDEVDPDKIRRTVVSCREITPRAGANAIKEALQTDPEITGVVAWSDLFASGAIHIFQQLGKRIPEEVEIIGYDNILAPHLPIPIGSIETPVEEMAALAINTIDRCLFMKSLPAPRTITLEPRLMGVE